MFKYLRSSPGADYHFPLALAELQVWYSPDPHSSPRVAYYFYFPLPAVNPDRLGDY